MANKPLILLVEDKKEILEKHIAMIQSIKDNTGESKYDVIIAENGLEALKIVKQYDRVLGFGQNQIKCILLDLRMPVMNGQQFFKKLRSMERWRLFARLIPVVFLTAYEDEEKWVDAMEGAATDYIQKPVTQEKLNETLSMIIDTNDNEILTEKTREKGILMRETYLGEDTPPPLPPPLPHAHAKLVLLLEDKDEDAQKMIQIITNISDKKGRQRFNPIWVKTKQKALDVMQANKRFLGFAPNRIDCILVNVHMQDSEGILEGIHFINAVRVEEEKRLFGRFIPAIFIAEKEDSFSWEEAMHNWISGFLLKPITKVKLEAMLQRLFDEWDPESLIELIKCEGKKKLEVLDKN